MGRCITDVLLASYEYLWYIFQIQIGLVVPLHIAISQIRSDQIPDSVPCVLCFQKNPES